MNLLWQVFLLIILCLPLLTALAGLFSQKLALPWITSIWAMIMVCIMILLVFAPATAMQLPFQMLPQENKGFATNRISLQLVFLLAGSGMLITLHADQSTQPVARWRNSIIMAMFGLAAAIIFASDFLTRLLALELSALCISLYPLTETQYSLFRRWMHVLEIYLPLRLAGALTIAVLFNLAAQGGQFQIDALINTLQEHRVTLAPIMLIMLLVAVIIKSSAPPFHHWFYHRERTTSIAWNYSAGILTASLAYYLVYRLMAIFPIQTIPFLMLAFILSLFAVQQGVHQRQRSENGYYLFIFHNIPTILLLMAFDSKSALITFLLLLIPVSTFAILLQNSEKTTKFRLPLAASILAMRLIFPIIALKPDSLDLIPFLLLAGTLLLQMLTLILLCFSPKTNTVSKEDGKLLNLAERQERDTFRELTQSIVDVEYQLDHVSRYANSLFSIISKSVNKLHNDSLDRYLSWTVFFIIFIIFIVMIT